MDDYDLIIIGGRAGCGKSILMNERGDFLPRETENWGPPRNRGKTIVRSFTFNYHVVAKHLFEKLKSSLKLFRDHHHLMPNSACMGTEIPIAGVSHRSGTCRFGTDAATSVHDIDSKTREVDNLYGVATSFFPSIGAVNTSLTDIANALRDGNRLRLCCGRIDRFLPSRLWHGRVRHWLDSKLIWSPTQPCFPRLRGRSIGDVGAVVTRFEKTPRPGLTFKSIRKQ